MGRESGGLVRQLDRYYCRGFHEGTASVVPHRSVRRIHRIRVFAPFGVAFATAGLAAGRDPVEELRRE